MPVGTTHPYIPNAAPAAPHLYSDEAWEAALAARDVAPVALDTTNADYARELKLGALVDTLAARGLSVGHVDARPVKLAGDRGQVVSRGVHVWLEAESADGTVTVYQIDGFNAEDITVSWHVDRSELRPADRRIVNAVRRGWAGKIQALHASLGG